MLPEITLQPLYHRGKEVIALCTQYTTETNVVPASCRARWSQTHRVWYLPWGKASYHNVVTILKPLARVDNRNLIETYLD